MKDFAVRQFGEDDEPALLAGMAAVMAVVAVAAGVLSRRRALPGLVLAALPGVVRGGAATVPARPTTDSIVFTSKA